ncbi:MAG: hypothetical protein E6Q97_05825 [Desulfurellales bacterium]|nr:MAG: hypothetical protein E6Q97_05825 [Desulfurellales bacterium]
MNTIQQSLLVERTGSHSTHTDNNPPTQVDCIAELERVNSAIDGRLGDPGPLQPTARRVESIVGELEKRLANATMTLESIGRAEGV